SNSFGLYRQYPNNPTHNPDDTIGLQDLVDGIPPKAVNETQLSSISRLSVVPDDRTSATQSYFPFKNSTIFGLMNWMWTGSAMKSICEMKNLINFLKSEQFKKEDLEGFDIKAETGKFDQFLEGSSSSQRKQDAQSKASSPKDGWHESAVRIQVPDLKPHKKEDIPTFSVPGLLHRSIVEIIKATFSDPASRLFHYTPFKSFWRSNIAGSQPQTQRVYDELYTCDAMFDAHEELQKLSSEPGCTLERVVAGMMLWSDSTHLASFGTASLWPIYLYFGNQSKYVRGKPKAGACHHLAYLPKLPSGFWDFYFELTGDGPSEDVLTHCRRELMHAVWTLLLDEEFMYAYEHGIIIECPDGVSRRFYPRIFTYSADYPEKILLATLRNFGLCPCPRCLVPKDKIPDVGKIYDDRRRQTSHRIDSTARTFDIDTVRKFIYEKGEGVKSAAVERVLRDKSLVPTANAFSSLLHFGFNFFKMFVPDFMHEFELGIWKALFTHLVRIIVSEGRVQEFNKRYRQVPTFGRSTIRKFSQNASGMKKMAARNYEDLLQCAIPVFDGLLDPEHDRAISTLLFTVAEWHTLAKLRMHTDLTLGWLHECTATLGKQLRRFQSYTCSFFDTRELPSEEAARSRKTKKAASSSKSNGKQKTPTSEENKGPTPCNVSNPSKTPPKKKLFNLVMIKLHALGDYVSNIRLFGTSDSYSTQPGELEHRRVKRYYARTNKNGAVRQITRLERREHVLLHRIRLKNSQEKQTNFSIEKAGSKRRKVKVKTTPSMDFAESESLPYTPPEYHHHISTSRNFPIHVQSFINATTDDDPAIKDFYPKLQEHILARILHPTWSGDGNEFSDEERNKVFIVNERLYRHKVMRINYTTYDVRLGQDSVNARNHADIMVLSHTDEDHPFEYGRIISIFHVDVVIKTEEAGVSLTPVSKEVLWVRWYKRDSSYEAGFKRKRLHRLQFLPCDDTASFGFLDPDEVIRAVHLIPVFRYGKTNNFLPEASLGRAPGELSDWKYFYVNIFVDRDMYMRFAGGGIGHYKVELGDARVSEPSPDNPVEGEEDEDEEGDDNDKGCEGEDDGAEDEEDDGGEGSAVGEGEDNDEAAKRSDDESAGEDIDDDELGAEDGEGGFEDAEDDEGYAPL
ncbi:hypothetical protein HYPSUDRAFT_143405, partial [Hypholoma sublateritium FD-334 SS-4]